MGKEAANWVKFLGTAGARFVVMRQLRASGGVWLSFEGRNVVLDPGPGTLVRCAASRPRLDPSKLDAIILTHRHIDHSTDINVMIEAMTNGGFKRRGLLFAPADALESDDPVILRYVRDFVERVEILKPEKTYEVGELSFHTSVRHQHAAETYGVMFDLPGGKVSFLVDTQFFPALERAYAGSRLLVTNVVRLKPDEKGEIMHLCLEDAKRLIRAIKPERAVLTHFGMTMLQAKPWELAEAMTKDLGIEVIAARDGMTVEV
jgi:phosphoribosyl 1,2-cyclic phosphodiesterase